MHKPVSLVAEIASDGVSADIMKSIGISGTIHAVPNCVSDSRRF